jgi:hypothetical protein
MFFTTVYNVEWMILKGLNPYHKNYEGKIPLEYVAKTIYLQVDRTIQNAILKINIIKNKLPQNVVVVFQSFF